MHILAFHTEGMLLKAALLHKKKNQIFIDTLRSFPTSEQGLPVKPLYLLGEDVEKLQAQVVTGLNASKVLYREVQTKLKSKRKILQSLPFQIESSLPYPPSETILFCQLGEEKIQKTAYFATSFPFLKEHLERLQEHNINPDIISVSSQALFRFGQFFFPNVSNIIHFHIGAEESLAICICEGRLQSSYAFSFGTSLLKESIKEDLSLLEEKAHEIAEQIDFQAISSEKFPRLSFELEKCQREINRLLSFFKSKNTDISFKCILTGQFSPFFQFSKYIQEFLQESVEVLFLSSHQEYDFCSLQSFAIPIGLAIDALKKDAYSVQMRTYPFISKPSIQKKSRQIAKGILYSALFTFTALFIGGALIKAKQEDLTKKFQQVFPKGIKKNAALSLEILEGKILLKERELYSRKNLFYHVITAPLVAEVLSWISTHPELNIQHFNDGKEESIEIKSLKYHLLKYPKISSPKLPYQAKVEIEFYTLSPKLARDFHNALLKGDEIVDQKKEITWSVNNNTYHTSFFLKSQGRLSR